MVERWKKRGTRGLKRLYDGGERIDFVVKEVGKVWGYRKVVFNDEELVLEDAVVFGEEQAAGVVGDDVAASSLKRDGHDVLTKELSLLKASAFGVGGVELVDAREDGVQLAPLDVVVFLEVMVRHGLKGRCVGHVENVI